MESLLLARFFLYFYLDLLLLLDFSYCTYLLVLSFSLHIDIKII